MYTQHMISEALLARNELLISWLLILPWRQRNLRECRVGDDPCNVNVFKAERPQLDHLKLPRWLEEAVRTDPHTTFWQYYFREDETKMDHRVRGIIPRALLPILEEYLVTYRPVLCRTSDPGTLFVTRNGHAFDAKTLRELVCGLTLRFGGRVVTPHLFRDIVAYKWLDDHPEDYLTVSKILWHRSIKTTLRIYGRNFDESNGVAKMDEWLGHRGQ